jgi:hypothetical protein
MKRFFLLSTAVGIGALLSLLAFLYGICRNLNLLDLNWARFPIILLMFGILFAIPWLLEIMVRLGFRADSRSVFCFEFLSACVCSGSVSVALFQVIMIRVWKTTPPSDWVRLVCIPSALFLGALTLKLWFGLHRLKKQT